MSKNVSTHGRWVGLTSYVGFCFSSLCLLTFLDPNLRLSGAQVGPLLVGLGTAAFALGILSRFVSWRLLRGDADKPGKAFWFAFGVAAAAGLAAKYIPLEQIYSYIGVGSFVLLISMILAWRVHAIAYFCLAVCVGIVTAKVQHDWSVGLAVFVLVTLAMASCYWLYMLVSDHRLEGKKLIRRWQRTHPFGRKGVSPIVLLNAAGRWMPALCLAFAGLLLHDHVQAILKQALYEGEYVTPEQGSAPLTKDLIEERDIEEDWVRMLNEAEAEDKADFVVALDQAYAEADAAASEATRDVRDELEENKPKGLSDRPCDSMVFKVLRTRVASSRTGCQNVIKAGNKAAKERYAKLQERINEIALDTYEKGKTAAGEKRAELQQTALQMIAEEYEAYRYGIRRGFQLIELLRLVGNLALIGALFAGYQMVLGRMLFDSEDPDAGFQLSQGGGNPLPVQFTLSAERIDEKTRSREEVIELRELLTEEKGKNRLFYAAYKRITRSGAKSDVCLPQWWNCFLQRLVTKSLFLCRIDPDETYTTYRIRGSKDDRVLKPTNPTLSVEGDSHLVAIRLTGDQEIHFRMASLAAFSGGVILRSIYSTHVAGYLLGLGNFQCVATGTGYIVLKSTGQDVGLAPESPNSSCKFLAWDRRTTFRLHQSLTWTGIWFNDPDLLIKGSSDCAVIDQSAASLGIFQKVWRLLRYLFLPI